MKGSGPLFRSLRQFLLWFLFILPGTWYSMSRCIAQRRTRKRCRNLSLSERAMRKQTSSRRQVRCGIKKIMTETRAKTVQQEREEVYAALQHAARFHCLVEEWKDCENLKPKPKEK